MAYIYQYTSTPNNAVNLLPASMGETLYWIKEALKQAGWVVKASSDGTTYNSTSDIITSAGAVSNGMGNANAWFRIQHPSGAGNREYLFQRTSGELNAKVYYSAIAGCTGGSPNATTLPTATDGQFLLGSSGAFAQWMPTAGTYRLNIGTDNAAPYGFYAIAIPTGGGTQSGVFCDPLVSGTYSTSDPDPCLTWAGFNQAFAFGNIGSSSIQFFKGWWKYGSTTPTAVFAAWSGFGYASSGTTASPDALGVNPHSGFDDLLPIYFGRIATSANNGLKGLSSIFRWNCTTRVDGDYVDIGAERRLCFDSVNIPFPQAVVPVI